MTTAPRHLLVVCEGNHCRSPLAEALFRRALPGSITVSSAGLAPRLGDAAHGEAVRWATTHGLDLSAHRGRAFTTELALAAELILVMDENQKRACEQMVPSARGRVFLLGQWLKAAEREVPDPMGNAPSDHDRAYDLVQACVESWLLRLLPASVIARTS